MKKIIITFFLLFPALSFASLKYDVSCPVDSDVEIGFEWRSTVNIIVSSNTASFQLSETPSGVYSFFKIPASSDSSGIVSIVFSSGAVQSLSCVEKVQTEEFQLSELYLKMYMFAFGAILALSFISGMKGSI